MKSILVAGGAGFLGSHLCDKLLDAGHRVTCVDNFVTGSRDNVAHLHGHERFELLEHDIVEPLEIDGPFDQIFNLACPASPIHYQKDPLKTIQCSTVGVSQLLELARRHGARLLQASTSEIYGDPLEHPQRENYWGNVNTLGPRSCYDEGKRLAETLCREYHHQHGVEVRIIRIFNTYGPRMSLVDGRVLSGFVIQALEGKPLTIFGQGEQTRSFCYVEDLLEGMVRLMNQNERWEAVNVGNPEEITVHELATRVLEATESESTISYLPLPKDDPTRRRPDISLARELLGWEPTVSLEEGLRRTIAYFRTVVNQESLRALASVGL